MDHDEICNRFLHHPPTNQAQVVMYEAIRKEAMAVALYLNRVCPESREKLLAITHLEEAVFWANASIARHDA